MKEFKYLLGGFFLSEFGRAMYFVTVSWLLYEITSDAYFTGLLLGLGFLPGLVLNLFLGVFVDRFNRKKLTIIANIISSISIVLLLVYIAIFDRNPWVIIIVHMVLQVCGSLFRPAIQAFMAESFEKKFLPKIFSQTSSTGIIGGLVGALFGGILISIISAGTTLVIVAVSLVISAILLLKIESKKNRSICKEGSSIRKEIVEGFQYVKRNKFLLGLFVIMFTGQLVYHSSLGFLSVYTVTYLMKSASIYGLLDATISVGGIFAGFLGAWWWSIAKQHFAICSLVIIVVGLLLVGLTPILPFAFCGVFLIGVGTTWIRVLLQSLQQMATEPEYHGRMASFRMIGNQGAVVLAAPILGWVASNYGADYIYLCLLIPVSVCVIFAVYQAKGKEFIEMIRNAA
ncbi:MFS transporter [Anaerobacillus alkaliphilus]|nr:MFS transporter [Anaerobacillus alkaliphilus]